MRRNLLQGKREEEGSGRRGARRRGGRERVAEEEEEGKAEEFVVDVEASKLKARNIDKFSRKVCVFVCVLV